MEDYELMDAPADASLPEPEDVVEGSGALGNLMLQIVAGVQLLAGLGLLIAWIALPSLSTVVAPVAALGFLAIGLFLFVVVANARLSDRFRAAEFRNRLRALDLVDEEDPEILPEDVRRAGSDTAADTDAEGDEPVDATDR